MIKAFKPSKSIIYYLSIFLIVGFSCFALWKIFSMNQTYRYEVHTSSPRGYEGLIESTNSYLMDKNGEIITGFGGSRSSGYWGGGVQSSSLSHYQLPASFKVRWYSLAEKQYWEGTFKLPEEKVKVLFSQTRNQANPFSKVRRDAGGIAFYYFIVNVTPGGGVFVWVNGHKLEYLGFFQAHKIAPMDWSEMEDFTLGFKAARETLEQDNLDVAKEDLPAEESAAIAAGKIPGVEHWLRRQQYYDWRFVVDAPFTLKDYQANYTSGEFWYTYADQAGQYHHEAVPKRLTFVIEDEQGKRERLIAEFDEEQMMRDFKELAAGSKKITLRLKFDKNLTEVEPFLENGTESREFNTTKADIWDLYD